MRTLLVPPAQIAITYNRQTISLALVRSKTNRLTISVHPNLAVTVKAPISKSLPQIKARVERRAGWIAKQLQHFRQSPPAPPTRRYVSGETHLFVGRQYRLKLHAADQNSVKLIGRYLHVHTPNPSHTDRVRTLVENWYRERATQLLHRYVQQCYARLKRFGIPSPTVRLQKMQKRWGSCTPKRSIILNTELIKAPPQCIDYVIVHELCHLRIHGHSETFFRLLTACMPDWRIRKRRLESVALTTG